MDKYLPKSFNHYIRYQFFEEFLQHHLILGNKMNWLIKTYTHNYSVWLRIKLEKTASKGSFFPKVFLKVCFFCFSNDFFAKKKNFI